MPDGVILDTKDSLVPTHTILDQGYNVINVRFKTATGRKTVFVPDGTHPRLKGDPTRHPTHCVRDGKDWRMTLEQPSGLANDLEVQQAEAKGRQAVMEQTRREVAFGTVCRCTVLQTHCVKCVKRRMCMIGQRAHQR